jgi:hypothetical protein
VNLLLGTNSMYLQAKNRIISSPRTACS